MRTTSAKRRRSILIRPQPWTATAASGSCHIRAPGSCAPGGGERERAHPGCRDRESERQRMFAAQHFQQDVRLFSTEDPDEVDPIIPFECGDRFDAIEGAAAPRALDEP